MKRNNKGFSLVELIIVIAIMAILVGVVGATVIPYLDKSREQKDIAKLDGLCMTANSAWSFEAFNISDLAVYTITITAAKTEAQANPTTHQADGEKLKKQMLVLSGDDGTGNLWNYCTNFQSKKGVTIHSITITFNMTTKEIVVKTFDNLGNKVFDDMKNIPNV